MKAPTLTIQERRDGTYRLTLHRPNLPDQVWRRGIPSLDEALRRAETVRDLCGYRVDRKVRAA